MVLRKLKICKSGYVGVDLFKNGKYKHMLVHRLVAIAFIPNPKNLPCINHKDENKKNNNVENLEWCTYSYNNSYGKLPIMQSKRMSVPVMQLTMDGEEIRRFESINEAGVAIGCHPSEISNVCRGVSSFTHGYKWDYIDKDRKKKADEKRKILLEKSKKRKEELRKRQCKHVAQYNKDGSLLAKYNSIKEAANAIGATESFISGVCSGYRHSKTCYGYIFKFIENDKD